MQYKALSDLYEELDSTSKRLDKTAAISKFISALDDSDIEAFCLLINGKIFPEWEEKKIGVAARLVIKAISKSTSASEKEIEALLNKAGDLGMVAQELMSKRRQVSLFPKRLTLNGVLKSIRDLASIEGSGSVDRKIQILSDMLISSSPAEVKYLVRTVLETLRVGIGVGTLRDAIVWSYLRIEDISALDDRKEYDLAVAKVQQAADISNDYALIIKILRKEGLLGLDKIGLLPGKPVNAMLFQKAIDIDDAFSIVGRPAAFEYKYDGFRLQVHKEAGKIKLFTRRLEDVTLAFPDLIAPIRSNVKGGSFILDAEAVGFDPKTHKYLPFQSISQRIRRKYNVEQMAAQFPVELNVFDVLYHDGKSMLNEDFEGRRRLLEKIVTCKENMIVLSKSIVTDSADKARKFYEESISAGEEGVMAKNLKGIYKPGSRVGYGVKIKPTLEPLDLVVVSAEWGEGKRKGWLTSFTLACLDETGEEYLQIGKVSTGLKELDEEGVSFSRITELLRPLILKTEGKVSQVRPKVVIEVAYEEIQKSVNYSSGYALRFPRFVRLRDDKGLDEINSISDVEQMFKAQRNR